MNLVASSSGWELEENSVLVIPNDAFLSIGELTDHLLSLGYSLNPRNDSGSRKIHNIVISPGPGHPSNYSDVGICPEVLAYADEWDLPVLGVCLGHQLLAHTYGAVVTRNIDGPVHGRLSEVIQTEEDINVDGCGGLFEGLKRFDAVRYHSLSVTEIRRPIVPLAYCHSIDRREEDEGDIINMALKIKGKPFYGVQFHPESVGMEEAGRKILTNFRHITALHWQKNLPQGGHSGQMNDKDIKINDSKLKLSMASRMKTSMTPAPSTKGNNGANPPASKLDVHIYPIPPSRFPYHPPSSKDVFNILYSEQDVSFWLDSSSTSTSQKTGTKYQDVNARFSIMGDHNTMLRLFGNDDEGGILQFWGDEDEDILTHLQKKLQRYRTNGYYLMQDEHGEHGTSLQQGPYVSENTSLEENSALPFDYRGGYVGFLGYEVRYDVAEKMVGVDGPLQKPLATNLGNKESSLHVPRSSFLFADQSIVFDHKTGKIYLVGISRHDDLKSYNSIVGWMTGTVQKLVDLVPSMAVQENVFIPPINGDYVRGKKKQTFGTNKSANLRNNHFPVHPLNMSSNSTFLLNRSATTYQQDIERCNDLINQGETYEVCLTNKLVASNLRIDPHRAYSRLRESNAAPFSAYLQFDIERRLLRRKSSGNIVENYSLRHNDCSPRTSSFALCCSSPERFLSISSTGMMESKPIKGTVTRGRTPEKDASLAQSLFRSVKDRAENLMIADLVRNDMGRVASAASVHVPSLMQVESFATVHQLVSTVRGHLDSRHENFRSRRQGYDAIDAVRACFPGGSMTGAPKVRTMEIIDELEQGVPRGAYSGSLGYFSLNGAADLNIIIRTAVVTPEDVSIGTGGAITTLSNSLDEYNEMMLKGWPVMEAITGEVGMKEDKKRECDSLHNLNYVYDNEEISSPPI